MLRCALHDGYFCLSTYQTDGAQPGFWYASSPTTWVRLTDQATASNQFI